MGVGAGEGSVGIDWEWEEREAVGPADQSPSAKVGTPSAEFAETHLPPQVYQGIRSAEAEGTLGDALQEIQSAEMQARQTLHPWVGRRRADLQNLLETAGTEHLGLAVDLTGIAAAVECQENPFA